MEHSHSPEQKGHFQAVSLRATFKSTPQLLLLQFVAPVRHIDFRSRVFWRH